MDFESSCCMFVILFRVSVCQDIRAIQGIMDYRDYIQSLTKWPNGTYLWPLWPQICQEKVASKALWPRFLRSWNLHITAFIYQWNLSNVTINVMKLYAFHFRFICQIACSFKCIHILPGMQSPICCKYWDVTDVEHHNSICNCIGKACIVL